VVAATSEAHAARSSRRSHLAKRLKSEGHHIVACDWKRNEHMPVRAACGRRRPPPAAAARAGADAAAARAHLI
jgi:hypothetical protein